MDAGGIGPAEILRKHHIAPELARYELHRVWVVQATLEPGAKHIYSRRIFYVDEDSWQIEAESYDLQGRLWRVNEAHAINFYDVPTVCSALEVFHDLQPTSLERPVREALVGEPFPAILLARLVSMEIHHRQSRNW